MVKSIKGMVGLLVDAVIEIVDMEQKPVAMPKGVSKHGFQYFRGIQRYKEPRTSAE
ncbi:MAG TPA: hypothetical protein VEI57_05090 [Nitrospirota bacterium]|nr:hypothetical protein [Nitrospirota bacterium]